MYSIWITFHCSRREANTISSYRIQHQALYGKIEEKSRHDLLQVIMVRIPNEGKLKKAVYPPSLLHEMLYDLFVAKDDAKNKLEKLNRKYRIKTAQIERRLNVMCNLSEALIQEGTEKGID